MMAMKWYALAVQPRKEGFVEKQLLRENYGVVCPRYLKRTVHGRSVKSVASPLFPGYIFVKLELKSHGWRKINWLPGSIGLVSFNNRPTPLNREFSEEFLMRLGPDGTIEEKAQLGPGDTVQAIGGPFDKISGEVIRMCKGDRVRILMDALNRKVETTLPRSTVIAAA